MANTTTLGFNDIVRDTRQVIVDNFAAVNAEVETKRKLVQIGFSIYVRKDGSDDNDGLENSAEGAVRTIQRAVDLASHLDIGSRAITIMVGEGTYNENVVISHFSHGLLYLSGNSPKPGDFFSVAKVRAETGPAFFVEDSTMVWIKDFEIEAPLGTAVEIKLSNVELDGLSITADVGVKATEYAHVFFSGTQIGWYGGMTCGIVLEVGSTAELGLNLLFVTCSFESFLRLSAGSVLGVLSTVTFFGAPVGKSYEVGSMSVLFRENPSTVLPGDVLGTTSGGGIFE
jgi:hypothetical protein